MVFKKSQSRLIDSIRLILRSNAPRSLIPLLNDPTVDSFVVANALQSAPSPDSALSLLEILKTIPHFCHTQATIRALAKILANFMELMKWHAAAGDLESVLHAWNRYRVSGKQVSIEAYNIVMRLYVLMGKDSEAMQIFHKIISEGAIPNSRTYTVVLEHLANSGKLDSAIKIDGILPGRAMQLSLQRMQEAGFVHETDEFLRGMLPDERIKNVGFCVDSSDDDDDENNHSSDDAGVDGVQLKPWLDPRALANALNNWDPNEVLALEEAKFIWTTRLVCKILRNFNSPETAWKFFCWVAYQPGGFNHNIYTVQRMMTLLARHGHVELVEKLLLKIRREEIRLPVSTIRLIIDFYGISRNADAALKVFHDAESLSADALDVLEQMFLGGICPDVPTFSGLMYHFALEGDFKTVQKLFMMVRQSGVEPDAYMFKVLIHGYCKCERSALALRVFEDMRSLNLMPDAATKNLLVKCLWKEGRRREAASVEERCEEINYGLPFALRGHMWTISSADLKRVYDIYSNSFAAAKGPNLQMELGSKH
ncbi:Pentatricopeptide repeat-containing protein [Vitis vinifera]|uniref:Pentatricopeptide repeat-containing protein n=1 Tax=Vitis vinifera TaxID=29760 RepID=A0A438GM39_VITVI|nr:Pentatricopeptide repeat-containing protein [Vitis vinifera]